MEDSDVLEEIWGPQCWCGILGDLWRALASDVVGYSDSMKLRSFDCLFEL